MTMENTVDKNAEALEQAGWTLFRLLKHFEHDDVEVTLFDMLQASLRTSNDHPDEYQIESRCHIYDCLRRIFAEFRKIDMPKGHRFMITIEQPSTSK